MNAIPSRDRIEENLRGIPESLRKKYGPEIKKCFDLFNDLAGQLDAEDDLDIDAPGFEDRRNAYLNTVATVHGDFAADGGTEDQWNILAPAIHYGLYTPDRG